MLAVLFQARFDWSWFYISLRKMGYNVSLDVWLSALFNKENYM